ncbi:MAG: alternative ribosome rescue aminoacyl-tRNA hydrolase ArfB [Patescibacteria group bacterium]|jgi:ribosome-associated protein
MPFRGEGWPPVFEEQAVGRENQEQGTPDVPEREINIDFVRSSGPGGQNVNKTSTKAQLRWNVGASAVFSEEQKALIRAAAGHRLNSEDEIVLAAQNERSQSQNRDEAVRRLRELVAEALAPKKERIETRVSRGQKRQRLDEKRLHSERKQQRRPPRGGY